MNKYPSSVIMLSFAFLMSMFVPMIMIGMFAMCPVCSMGYIGKNIANCRRNPQFLSVICALCVLRAHCTQTPPMKAINVRPRHRKTWWSVGAPARLVTGFIRGMSGYSEQLRKCRQRRGWSTPRQEGMAAAVNAFQPWGTQDRATVSTPLELRGAPPWQSACTPH